MLATARATAASTWTSFQQGSASSLHEVVQAESRVAAAATSAALPFAHSSRLDWVLLGERPSPTITRLVKGTNKNTIIPSLIGNTGQESSDPSVMAQDMLQYWEDLSNAGSVSSPEASAAVLTSVRDHSDSIPLPPTIILVAENIPPPEVPSPLRRAKQDRSPVETGITN